MAPAADMTTAPTGVRSDEPPASAFSKPGGGLPVAAAMGGEEESDKPKVSPSPLPFSVETRLGSQEAALPTVGFLCRVSETVNTKYRRS